MTTRERFDQHVADPECAGCHAMINPVGYTFEGYDGAGIRRERDNDKAVDTSGSIITAKESTLVGPLTGVRELAERLSVSRQVHDCMASHFMRFALGRADEPEDACALDDAQEAFWASKGKFDELRVAIVMGSSFRTRSRPEVMP